MSRLAPLHGHTVAPDFAGEVVAPPYDALIPEERDAHVRAHPRSFLSVLPSGPVASDEELADSRRRLDQLIAQGAFEPRPGAWVAVYRITEGDHVQTGLVADVPLDWVREGRVLPHEHTRPERVEEVVRFLDAVEVASSAVSLAFRDAPTLREQLTAASAGEPDVTVDDAGVRQELWIVEEPGDLLAASDDLGRLYITDGHHRTTAALEHADRGGRRADALLAVLFPADELRLADFHRVVTEPELPAEEVVDILADAGWEAAELDAPRQPQGRGEVVLVADPRSWLLRLPTRPPSVPGNGSESSDPVADLDAARVQEELLGAVLGIVDPRSDPRLRHVPGDAGVDTVASLVHGTDAIGVLLHPPCMSELMAVADAGRVMPPKSTYFTPKVRSGLFLVPR